MKKGKLNFRSDEMKSHYSCGHEWQTTVPSFGLCLHKPKLSEINNQASREAAQLRELCEILRVHRG